MKNFNILIICILTLRLQCQLHVADRITFAPIISQSSICSSRYCFLQICSPDVSLSQHLFLSILISVMLLSHINSGQFQQNHIVQLDIVQSCAFTHVGHSRKLPKSDVFIHREKLGLMSASGRAPVESMQEAWHETAEITFWHYLHLFVLVGLQNKF